jgi:hypothetical protein
MLRPAPSKAWSSGPKSSGKQPPTFRDAAACSEEPPSRPRSTRLMVSVVQNDNAGGSFERRRSAEPANLVFGLPPDRPW